MKPITVKFKKLHPDAIMPTKATTGSACFDVYALSDLQLLTAYVASIPTGLSFEVPSGYLIEIRPRSGLSAKGITIANSPGTLDSDYRGELIISLVKWASGFYEIKRGDRIAQIRLVKEEPTEFVEVQELSPTERGEGGFGSTGK